MRITFKINPNNNSTHNLREKPERHNVGTSKTLLKNMTSKGSEIIYLYWSNEIHSALTANLYHNRDVIKMYRCAL